MYGEVKKLNSYIQPGTHELVSMIETISADGSLLPAFLIWKAQYHRKGWYQVSEQNKGLRGYTYATSPSGWIDNSLGLYYIQRCNEHTRHHVEDANGITQQHHMHLINNHSNHIA